MCWLLASRCYVSQVVLYRTCIVSFLPVLSTKDGRSTATFVAWPMQHKQQRRGPVVATYRCSNSSNYKTLLSPPSPQAAATGIDILSLPTSCRTRRRYPVAKSQVEDNTRRYSTLPEAEPLKLQLNIYRKEQLLENQHHVLPLVPPVPKNLLQQQQYRYETIGTLFCRGPSSGRPRQVPLQH